MPEFAEQEIRTRIGNGSILGISIDTAVFHGYGYNLRHPVLAKLDQFKVGGVDRLAEQRRAASQGTVQPGRPPRHTRGPPG